MRFDENLLNEVIDLAIRTEEAGTDAGHVRGKPPEHRVEIPGVGLGLRNGPLLSDQPERGAMGHRRGHPGGNEQKEDLSSLSGHDPRERGHPAGHPTRKPSKAGRLMMASNPKAAAASQTRPVSLLSPNSTCSTAR